MTRVPVMKLAKVMELLEVAATIEAAKVSKISPIEAPQDKEVGTIKEARPDEAERLHRYGELGHHDHGCALITPVLSRSRLKCQHKKHSCRSKSGKETTLHDFSPLNGASVLLRA